MKGFILVHNLKNRVFLSKFWPQESRFCITDVILVSCENRCFGKLFLNHQHFKIFQNSPNEIY